MQLKLNDYRGKVLGCWLGKNIGGTLGAILGIIHGAAALPARWLDPIGRSIKTLCVNRGDQGLRVPNTVDEMTERVRHLTPRFLGGEWVDGVWGVGL